MKNLICPMLLAALCAATLAVDKLASADEPTSATPFPDFRAMTSDELRNLNEYVVKHPGTKLFSLSQDYPTEKPAPEEYPWKKFNPTKHWREYLNAVLKYCYDGNREVGWNEQPKVVNGKDTRTWYHAPWLHWGRNGREALHGLTHERASQPTELSMAHTSLFQNWAISLYNKPGGYVIGKVWRDHLTPDVDDVRFPDGTVSVKFLFTAATDKEVPYLKDAPQWEAQIYPSVSTPTNPNLRRAIQPVRLLQIDLAVRDTQVDEPCVPGGTGWVFGTFTYHSAAPGATPWDKVEPVGIMWGNDPGVRVVDARNGKTLSQTIRNDERSLPFQHLGWAGRLNGPVDNPISSCLSCHSTSQWPSPDGFSIVPAKNLIPDSDQWMHWFRNIKSGEPFSPGSKSLDYSLQLAVGIQNLQEWRSLRENMGGESSPTSHGPAIVRPKVFRESPFSRSGE